MLFAPSGRTISRDDVTLTAILLYLDLAIARYQPSVSWWIPIRANLILFEISGQPLI